MIIGNKMHGQPEDMSFCDSIAWHKEVNPILISQL